MYVCMHVCMYVCIYVCMYVCIFVYMYVCCIYVCDVSNYTQILKRASEGIAERDGAGR